MELKDSVSQYLLFSSLENGLDLRVRHCYNFVLKAIFILRLIFISTFSAAT